MTSKPPEYGYIAYIDEAGDPGLSKVRPVDENGASEWLILSAVVLRTKWEPDVVGWVDDIRIGIGVTQRRHLHFRDLSPTRKLAVAHRIADLPLRAFVVCSNKKNMRQHRNDRAAQVPSQQWFYNWCVRLLLERITAFCAERSLRDYGELRPVKLEFSRRGGHRYSQTKAYHAYLSFQQEGDKVYLKKRQPVRHMLHTDLMEDHPHYSRAGLQLADTIASAFFQAADVLGTSQWSTAAAEALRPIMAKERGVCTDFGVALFPTPSWKADLTSEQQQIFRAYGYKFGKW